MVPSEGSFDLAAFRAGDRALFGRLYQEHHAVAYAAAARILPEIDAETVTHEVWGRLLADAGVRASFDGANFAAWLTRITQNRAIDYRRRRARELQIDESAIMPADEHAAELAARLAIERFRREKLPAKWDAVFEARFLRQLGQREAAEALGMHRTTLMYQEHRIRRLLARYFEVDR